jgi:hypothetical protein
MSFGIALPSWIVEKENSVWVRHYRCYYKQTFQSTYLQFESEKNDLIPLDCELSLAVM